MSSFYDDASLVVIPSGYKTSKVYAEKPTDGSGDLAFTRTGDTATRVNSAGLIERVRTNLLTYSNTFSNAAWTKVGGTTLTGGQADPFGGSDAWKWEATGAATIQLTQNPAGSAERTVSIYAKSGNITSFSLWIGSAVTFNLSSGTITAGTGTITSVGNGWYRCTATAAATSHNPYFVATTAGDHIFVAFAQMENGDIATSYIPTTTAAVSVGPTANTARLDYLGSTCPRLLLEPQRTNTITFSESFDNAGWSKLNATITANNTVSPDGYTNADRITDDAVNASHAVYRSGWDTTQRTASVYAKAGTSSKVYIINGTTGTGVFADLSTATFTATGTFTGTLTNVGNGWYRITATHTATGAETFAIGLFTGTSTTDYVGTGLFAYLWGAQLEAGAYATSYIPTLAASATRGADACSKTGISSLIGQQEGVVFVDFVYNGSAAQAGNLFNMNNSTTASVFVVRTSSGLTDCGVFENGTAKGQITAGAITIGTRIKLAYAYKSGSSALYINGTQIGTSSTTFTIPAALTEINLNDDTAYFAFQQNVSFNQHLLFTTRLTNAELAELTTL